MPGFDLIESYASPFIQWLLITSISATLIAGVVLIVQTLFGRWLTPAGRQRLWLLVIIRLLLPALPASALSIANIHFEKLWTHTQPKMHFDIELDHSLISEIQPAPLIHRTAPAPVRRSWSEVMPAAACLFWATAVIAMLVRLLWVNRSMAVRLRNATVINDEATRDLARQCADIAKLRRVPEIVVTDAVATPAVVGIVHPRILMPAGLLESLTPTQQRHVILHEMSHIRHHDLLGNWMLAILSISHWFNPLLWLAMARMKADRELARDAWVLRNSEATDAASYADTLIDLAQRLLIGGNHLSAPLPGLFGRTTSLRRRLHMIAGLSDSNRGSNLLGVGLLVVIASGVLTGARAQTPPTPATPPTSATKAPTTRPTTPRALRPRPTVDSLTASIQQKIESKQYSQARDDIRLLLQLNPGNQYALGVAPFVEEKVKSVPEDLIGKRLKRMLPTVQFDAVGFQDVLDFVADVSGLPISVNWKALDALNVDQNAPISVDVHNVALNTALTMILDQLGKGKGKIDYVIGDGYIYVTDARELMDLHLRTYDINDLLTGNDGKTRQQRVDELVKLIEEFIDRDTWKDNGGTIGTIREADGTLIISQKAAGHRHVAAFLQSLRNGRAKKD